MGLTGLSASVIKTLSKQLELDSNAISHAEYASKYSELHRQIRAELVLLRINDISFASSTDFLKTCAAELNWIEESAPGILEHISKRVGPKCCSPAPSPPRRSSKRVWRGFWSSSANDYSQTVRVSLTPDDLQF